MKKNELQLALKESRRLTSSIFLFSVFVNLLMLTGPLFMLQVYDRVLGSRSEATLVALFLLVVGLYGLMGFLEYARGRVLARAGARFQDKLDKRLFQAAITEAKDPATRAKPSRGLREMQSIQQLFNSPVLLALCDIPWTPFFIVLIFVFHPMLGWLAVTGGTILILLTLLNNSLSKEKTLRSQAALGHAQSFEDVARTQAELIASQGMIGSVTNRWRKLRDAALESTLNSADITGFFTAFTKAFRLLLQSAMLALGAYFVLQAELTAGAMIAGSILLGRALAPIEQSIGQWPLVQKAASGWKTLKALLAEVPEPADTAGLPNPDGTLELRAVSVMAVGRKDPVLYNITFKIQPGEVVGVIGKSGAGKSSLARVVLGLTAPQTGEIILGGAQIVQYSAEEIGKSIGYLPQSVSLFPATLMENIARMEEEPDAEAVQVAAQKAGAHELIKNLPNGYMTALGQADAILSGGQVQRVGLARALYSDPSLLVLDEPNSALDAEGTEAMNACIRDFKAAGKTVILMTHRPIAIAECDRLIVIDNGRIRADGPRDKVLASMVKNSDQVQQLVTKGKKS
ncbi:MAG: type I secretion system permease/ATPase [Pseudomonadota bacterium]